VRRFQFRLESVLNYRETLESDAETAYLGARAERIAAEVVFSELDQRRDAICGTPTTCVEDRMAIQRSLELCDDLERRQRNVVQVLEVEEESKRQAWIEARRDAEVMRKLKTKAQDEWQEEANREEQNALDEWAVLTRGVR